MARYYDLNSLVSTQDIADMFDVGMPAVSNWKVRHADFPEPVWRDFYDVREVDKWYRKRSLRGKRSKESEAENL